MRAARVRAVVNVDSSSQPYFRLERTIVEAGQQFGAVRTFAAPVAVRGIGLDAAWLPDVSELVTADRTALYTVTVSGGLRAPARKAVAELLARLYVSLR